MLDDYLKELQHITLLQPDEERALWQAYKDEGNLEARSRLIEQYQPLVFKETMRWHIHRDILSDALQEGRWASSKPWNAMITAVAWPSRSLPSTASAGPSWTI